MSQEVVLMNWIHNYYIIPVKMIYSRSEQIFIGLLAIFKEEKTTP